MLVFNEVELKTDIENETLLGTQEQIASIFQIDKSGISRHIESILLDGELDKSSIAKFAIDTNRGKFLIIFYE